MVSWIYVIDKGNNSIELSRSEWPEDRLNALEAKSMNQVRLLAMHPGSRKFLGLLRRRFQNFRLPHRNPPTYALPDDLVVELIDLVEGRTRLHRTGKGIPKREQEIRRAEGIARRKERNLQRMRDRGIAPRDRDLNRCSRVKSTELSPEAVQAMIEGGRHAGL